MEKKNFINEMKNYASKMPRTINEAINYEGVDPEMNNDYAEEPEMEPEMEPEKPVAQEPTESGQMDVMAFVDDIRKKSLKGMAQLADTPDDPLYEVLKKIWQTCDKAYADQKQASAPDRQVIRGGQNF